MSGSQSNHWRRDIKRVVLRRVGSGVRTEDLSVDGYKVEGDVQMNVSPPERNTSGTTITLRVTGLTDTYELELGEFGVVGVPLDETVGHPTSVLRLFRTWDQYPSPLGEDSNKEGTYGSESGTHELIRSLKSNV